MTRILSNVQKEQNNGKITKIIERSKTDHCRIIIAHTTVLHSTLIQSSLRANNRSLKNTNTHLIRYKGEHKKSF